MYILMRYMDNNYVAILNLPDTVHDALQTFLCASEWPETSQFSVMGLSDRVPDPPSPPYPPF